MRSLHVGYIFLIIALLVLIFNGWITKPWRSVQEIFVSHRMQPNLFIGSKYKYMNQSRKTIGIKSENLIYYGSNKNISRKYNSKPMMKKFSHPKNKSLMKRFPRCICIGIPKAGTEALLFFLNYHPQVVSYIYEPNLFSKWNYMDQLDQYLKLMPYSTTNQLTIEKSPQYVAWNLSQVPGRMHSFDPGIKLLLAVRNPVDRALSHYYHFQKTKDKDFEMEVLSNGEVNRRSEHIRKSIYSELMEGWYKVFPKHQIHIIDGAAFVKNPAQELNNIEMFLGIRTFFEERHFHYNTTKKFYCYNMSGTYECLRREKGHKHPPLQPELRKQLLQYFKPYNDKFFEMIGQTFNWTS